VTGDAEIPPFDAVYNSNRVPATPINATFELMFESPNPPGLDQFGDAEPAPRKCAVEVRLIALQNSSMAQLDPPCPSAREAAGNVMEHIEPAELVDRSEWMLLSTIRVGHVGTDRDCLFASRG